ncbi:hypothetical protein [Staphylococcus warneri]|jgi:hypothetical protein|uniref:hypothetical protein n=1 Tax=Staphylococcus warneri TaxID=1292 RepID=UPI0005E15130|nr:hypothetical protein [Staphylococcus warneri]PXX86402.1 hypothetical protein DLY76_02910 [Staphylococcus warneri]COE55104.1 Uncharacterised protein [Staphylococcus warneri]
MDKENKDKVLNVLRYGVNNNIFTKVTTEKYTFSVKNFEVLNEENIRLLLTDDHEVELKFDEILTTLNGKTSFKNPLK